LHFFVCQLQLQSEAEERRLKEEEEKKEKLRVVRERKEMEKKVSDLLRNVLFMNGCFYYTDTILTAMFSSYRTPLEIIGVVFLQVR